MSFTHATIQLVLCAKKLAAVEKDFLDGVYIFAAHKQKDKIRNVGWVHSHFAGQNFQ